MSASPVAIPGARVIPAVEGTERPGVRSDFLAFGKPSFSSEEVEAVARTIRSGWVGMGPETIAFEQELASFTGAPYVISVNSCTSALFLALLVHDIGPGDEVICPSLTWCATANAALYLGATPVFCDVDPDTMCVTPETVAAKIGPRTKAVMVVHYGGLAVDVEAIRKIAGPDVVIIEDAAHALGSRFADDSPVGSSGNLTCFSFYANKNLSTGEGGAIALFDDEKAERLKRLRQSGLSADAWKRYSQPLTTLTPGLVELGYKMNYTDLQAVIGRVQLRRQPEFHRHRLAIARRYHESLQRQVPALRFQHQVLDEGHARHLVVVALPLQHTAMTRDEFILELRARNIGASIHYAPLHSMPLYNPETQPALPGTEWLSQRNVTLPISTSMSVEDADYVVRHVVDVLQERN
jgi:perosamine synthetase